MLSAELECTDSGQEEGGVEPFHAEVSYPACHHLHLLLAQ